MPSKNSFSYQAKITQLIPAEFCQIVAPNGRCHLEHSCGTALYLAPWVAVCVFLFRIMT